MNRKISVVGVAGKLVADPETDKALEAGKAVEVTDSPFWRRRIRDGDVTIPAASAKTVTAGADVQRDKIEVAMSEQPQESASTKSKSK